MVVAETAWPPKESAGDEPPVRTRVADGVGYLVIHRPGKRNALDAATRALMIETLSSWSTTDKVHVVVVSGVGKSFAAGADLRELLARSPEEQRAFISPPHVYEAVERFPGPVIACVNGHALGAGCELLAACDLRVAGDGARIGQPETNLGLIPGGGGTQRLPRLIGRGQAARMIFTGDLLTGDEAHRIGLVEEVVPQDTLWNHVEALATRLAAKSPVALAAAKRALQAAWERPLSEGLAREIELFMTVFEDEEAKKRIAEFLETRGR
jgi:enoyl-CoA hydratase